MFNYKGIIVKERKDYLENPRTKVTTTIRSDYYDEYKKLMKALDKEMCKGYDIMLELMSEDEELLEKFINRLKRY